MSRQTIVYQEEPRGPSQLIEVIVNANGKGRVPFPDVQQLKSTVEQTIIIKAIRLVTDDILTNGMISGQTTAPVAELQKMAILLYSEGWEKGQYIPVLLLNDTSVPGGSNPHRYQPTRFDNWRNVDWSKTYLQYANGTVSANSPYVVMFEVEYTRYDKNGNELTGPPR